MAGNVVEIVVKSTNDSKAGFDEAKAGAAEAGAGMDEYAAAVDKATAAEQELRTAQAEADAEQARLDELRQSGTATADELAAAQDRVTEATLRSIDAQVRLGAADAAVADAEKAAGDAAETQAAKSDKAGTAAAGMGGKLKMALLGVAVGMGLAVKGAADFQQQTTKLVTSAGESAAELGNVQRGILSLSSATNTSSQQLASGMYMIESAGFHGAQGLEVLKAAAQGAYAEGADLGEVANAVTSGLNAYGLKARDATMFTDEMVAAVGAGKMTMQDLASSLSAVLPIAASARISFAQVGGAVATMTAQGMSARQAAQDLANSIRGLLNPSGVAVNEMNQFGISSVDVANKLGERGLTGTIGYLAQAIAAKMGPSGDVILSTFNQSRVAAQDAETMLKSLPPSIEAVAKAYLDGSISTKQWTADLKAMPPLQANLAREFGTVADKAHGFNSLLTSGQPAAQTFAAALGKMTGGATGLNTALMLTGSHAATFDRNVKTISESASTAGSDVDGWSTIQKEANFQIGAAEKAIAAMGDSLGLALLPAVTAVVTPLADFTGLVASNKDASIALALVIGGVLAGALGNKLAGAFRSVRSSVTTLGDGLSLLRDKLFATTAAEEEAAVAGGEMDAAMDANPIGAVILALTALVVIVVEVIRHWHQLAAVGKEVFGDIRRVITDVFDWVKGHWPLLAAILAGPIGMAAYLIIGHWRQILSGTQRMASAVVSWFARLPGMIIRAIGDLGSMLFQAGVNAIRGFISGAGSMIGSAVHTLEGWGHDLISAIGSPFGIHFSEPSEAAVMIRAGQKIPLGLAAGMLGGTGTVRAAAARIAGAVALPYGAPSYGGYGPGGRGGQSLTVHLAIDHAGGDDAFVRWLRNAIRVRGGNVQQVLGAGAG